MKRKLQFATWLGPALLALGLVLLAEPVLAQRGAGQGKTGRPPAKREQAQRPPQRDGGQGSAFRPGKNAGGGAGLPPEIMERLRRGSPEQQDRWLQNNRRFQGLPPEQKARIRENLRRWNALSPEDKREMLGRERVWQQMSPEQRRRVREEILPRWQRLEPDRRQAIQRRLRVLAPLSDSEREARLRDENFLRGLSPEDQELLRELSRLRLGVEHSQDRAQEPPPEPPQD